MALFCTAVCSQAAILDVSRSPFPRITFTDPARSITYTNVEVIMVQPDAIYHRLNDGACCGRIEFSKLPVQLQQYFGYSPEKAAQYIEQKKEEQRAARAAADAKVPRLASGTGFCVTDDGYILTSNHLIEGPGRIMVRNPFLKDLAATVIRADPANDIALLKVDAPTRGIPLASSLEIGLGHPVFTIGFPDVRVQGMEPKLTQGDINSITGIQDSANQFQISVPVQPGNSGGALVDRNSGNVIGVVSSRLNDVGALLRTGVISQNVNYAIKSGFVLAFLEGVPNLSGRLKRPWPTNVPRRWDFVSREALEATVMISIVR